MHVIVTKKAKKLDRNRHGLMKLLRNEEVSAAGTYSCDSFRS